MATMKEIVDWIDITYHAFVGTGDEISKGNLRVVYDALVRPLIKADTCDDKPSLPIVNDDVVCVSIKHDKTTIWRRQIAFKSFYD